MNQDETLMLVGGGILLLYLLSKSSANNTALQTAALNANAGLTAQQIAANQQNANTATIVGGVTSLVGSAANAISNNSGGSSYTQYASYNS